MSFSFQPAIFTLAALIAATGAQAQLRVTPGITMTIAGGTALVSDSLLIKPASALALSDFDITTSYTAVPGGSGGSSVQRVYEINQPVTTDGTIGLWYADAELNGNTASLLQIAYYDGTVWTTTSASTVNTAQRFVAYMLSSPATLSKITAVNGATALPLQLLAFDARADGEQAHLEWSVENPSEVQQYEVERAPDGQSFKSIGRVGGTSMRGYIFYDLLPLEGINYYRLRITGQDGSQSLSVVRPVLFSKGKAQQLLMYPLPVQDVLHIRLSIPPAPGATLRITDVAGKLIHAQPCTSGSIDLDMQALPAGVFFINYQDEAGSRPYKIEKL